MIQQGREVIWLDPGKPRLGPRPARRLGEAWRGTVAALGKSGLLTERKLGLFCSKKCPGELILKSYDLMQHLRDSGVTVISGFHAPMDRECLRILLRGKQPIIICPARSIEKMRIPGTYREPLKQGRLLLLSAFGPGHERMTRALAEKRNRFVAAVADAILFIHAAPGSRTEALCRGLVAGSIPLYAIDSDYNRSVSALGVRLVGVDYKQWFEPGVGSRS